MGDAVARMVDFLRDQRRREAQARACRRWLERVSLLAAPLQQIVDVFQASLDEPEWTVTVRTDAARVQFPLTISFDSSRILLPGRQLSDAPEFQIGASALFRCEAEGVVRGYRFPFHGMKRASRAELFTELGEVDAVSADDLAHAVVDFLEWAAAGKGSGQRRLRFTSPLSQPALAAEPVKLRIAA
ncbi:MAG: hypothetical protein FJ271_22525 [Planctomycetes bacterium]|nr:hypothetical protein [Planctomycetota bacterium]